MKSGMISCEGLFGIAHRVARPRVQVYDQFDRTFQGLFIDLQPIQDALVVLLAEGLEVLVQDLFGDPR